MEKLTKIVQSDSWIVPKSAMGPTNSSKNKPNSKIDWILNLESNAHLDKISSLTNRRASKSARLETVALQIFSM